jgi:hypothetical protein
LAVSRSEEHGKALPSPVMRWSKWFPLKSGWINRIDMDKYAYSKIIEDDFLKCEVNTNGK